MHGARGGAPKGVANGNYRHGGFTAEAQSELAQAQLVSKESASLLRILAQDPEENAGNEP